MEAKTVPGVYGEEALMSGMAWVCDSFVCQVQKTFVCRKTKVA